MWSIYYCPFGCGFKYQETKGSEAMAWFWTYHRTACPTFEEYIRKAENEEA